LPDAAAPCSIVGDEIPLTAVASPRRRGRAAGPRSASPARRGQRSLAKLEWRLAHDGKFDAPQKRLALGRLTLRQGRTELAVSGVVGDPGPRALSEHATAPTERAPP
jgi:hypothetical protein